VPSTCGGLGCCIAGKHEAQQSMSTPSVCGGWREHLTLNHSEASAEGAFAESDADMVKGQMFPPGPPHTEKRPYFAARLRG
jgi:hypothetical protein